ncbi:TolC family protein [Gammaproteobacteria bacterium LSUCC0057]|uniref:TolC family protein n=1 Tax=Gammaproteobacteria bacterium LSUCC0057 TaxID=2559237 RepID=A0A4Y8UGF5_9GAMM|nr:TolC family protein [Gammaproteobacteria bacterium LSUCC0057]
MTILLRSAAILLTLSAGTLLAAAPVAALTLENALQATLANNPALAGKQAEYAAAQGSLSSAKSQRLPSLSVAMNNVDNQDHNTQGTVVLRQPLWAFGKISQSIDQAEANSAVERLGVDQVRRELLTRTAVSFARIEGIVARQRVARQNVAEHERLYEQIQRRQEGQLASDADVRLAYSRLLQAKATLQRLHGEYRIALSDLERLTLLPVTELAPVSAEYLLLPQEQDLWQLALANSIDLAQKQAALEAADVAIRQAKSASLPTLYLQAEHDFYESKNNFADLNEDRAGLVLEASLDGAGFTSLGQVRSAVARRSAAEQDIDVTRNELRYRVEQLKSNLRLQNQLVEALSATVTALEGTAESFLRQYETGRKSWLDLLNTQRELQQQQLELEQSVNERLTIALQINALIGGLDAIVAEREQ